MFFPICFSFCDGRHRCGEFCGRYLAVVIIHIVEWFHAYSETVLLECFMCAFACVNFCMHTHAFLANCNFFF